MRLKTILIVLCSFFMFQTVHAVGAKESEKQPTVKLIDSTYKFSTVTEGSEIIHDFKIKNVGTAQLDILKVKPG